MLLWTTWAGYPQADPSDQLMILNGIYDGDIQRFGRVSHKQTAAGTWNLYRVRSAVVKRWRLQCSRKSRRRVGGIPCDSRLVFTVQALS